MQTATTLGFNSRITGVTNDYSATKDSDVVVIASGCQENREWREELIGINAGIVQLVASSILEHSPNTVMVVVSNLWIPWPI